MTSSTAPSPSGPAAAGGGPPPAFRPEAVTRFHYVGHHLDFRTPDRVRLVCHYALDDLPFTEQITFLRPEGTDAPWPAVEPDHPALHRAAHLLFLLAGISYYKAAAPPVVEVPEPGLTPAERRLLEAFYLDGLGEYAFRNDLDLTDLRIVAPHRAPASPAAAAPGSAPAPRLDRPLIPFGGGLDSIVTVEGIRPRVGDPALFVVAREADRFAAIETALAVADLPVVRAERRLDPKILRSRELGYRNGHVPVTGVISAIAVTAALLDGRDAVVMSNEWSASSGNAERNGRVVNHQWSKSLTFEDLFRAALAEAIPTAGAEASDAGGDGGDNGGGDAAAVVYYSWLRPFSELWVANRFLPLDRYHLSFRSCNRAFHIDPAHRLDHWCGHCDKCAFIDLILSPFLPRERLEAVFTAGPEPLANDGLITQFRALLGLSGDIKPFECVGDVDECRVAIVLAADRPDRQDSALVQQLAAETRPLIPGAVSPFAEALLRPLSEHRIPAAHAPADLGPAPDVGPDPGSGPR
ncbi:MAG: hypothetical protein R2761_15710 [Acidimicrobiales bacterium]